MLDYENMTLILFDERKALHSASEAVFPFRLNENS